MPPGRKFTQVSLSASNGWFGIAHPLPLQALSSAVSSGQHRIGTGTARSAPRNEPNARPARAIPGHRERRQQVVTELRKSGRDSGRGAAKALEPPAEGETANCRAGITAAVDRDVHDSSRPSPRGPPRRWLLRGITGHVSVFLDKRCRRFTSALRGHSRSTRAVFPPTINLPGRAQLSPKLARTRDWLDPGAHRLRGPALTMEK